MNKFLLGLLATVLAATLAGCGDTGTKKEDSTPADTSSETSAVKDENKADKKEDENVEESELGKMTIVYKNKELNENAESGPMKLNVSAVQLANLEVAEDYKGMFDEKDKVTVITVQMKAENTIDETMSFYPDQATLTTDTGDQIDASLVLSDSVGGDFFGKVNKEGNAIFLVDTPAEEIGEISLNIDGSHDESFMNHGDKIKMTIPTK
ncbi:hypothetical protein CSV79_01785 [Sporosarcina sp. P13]|uniref:LptM family lipoprotein n=1 Tax=Sporosarcina sp. P13 TaxID=2048263 RepID=UPI000C171100|nr:hypothetical protein [Sporosarcina sp. P13]PIC65376.1 hypothetical protein CSV79_01785 [Sporosarcina sp. P13]